MPEYKKPNINIISILTGILIPLLAVVIPYTLDYVRPEHKLSYELTGPISVKGKHALALRIRNNGRKLEKNVNVWLKEYPSFEFQQRKAGKYEERLDIAANTQFKINKEGDDLVVSLGDLRPDEEFELSILSEAIRVSRYSNFVTGISVKSNDNLGRLDAPSDFERVFYPIGFWAFLVLVVFMIGAGLYQEYAKSVANKEKKVTKNSQKK